MIEEKNDYIPAFKYRWLTPIYDPMMKWIMRESTFKTNLIKELNVKSGDKLLDLGCGTGTLTILIKKAYPDVEITGLDGDPDILKIAEYKAKRAGLNIKWEHGLAFELPYSDNYFDKVVSSMVIHHLNSKNKINTFKEIFRVLKPNGEFCLVDFGKPQNNLMRSISLIMKHLGKHQIILKTYCLI